MTSTKAPETITYLVCKYWHPECPWPGYMFMGSSVKTFDLKYISDEATRFGDDEDCRALAFAAMKEFAEVKNLEWKYCSLSRFTLTEEHIYAAAEEVQSSS